MVETSAQEKVEMGSSEELAETGDIQIRENFAETAFFYPQLRTNEKVKSVFPLYYPKALPDGRLWAWHIPGMWIMER